MLLWAPFVQSGKHLRPRSGPAPASRFLTHKQQLILLFAHLKDILLFAHLKGEQTVFAPPAGILKQNVLLMLGDPAFDDNIT